MHAETVISLIILLNIQNSSFAFLFPTNKCLCEPPPTCPELPKIEPICPPIFSCPTQQSPCSSSCRRSKRHTLIRLSNSTYIAEEVVLKRKKRDMETFDEKCNDDALRKIIVNNIDRVTSISKRRIQERAEIELNSRYNVICSRGDLSYVVSTEAYCQHSVGDVTCFVFKQLSDVVRHRLA